MKGKMGSMGKFLGGVFIMLLIFGAAWYLGYIGPGKQAPPTYVPPSGQPTTPGARIDYFPIQGFVACWGNSTRLKGASVELYTPGASNVWQLVDSVTSSTNSGSEGKFTSAVRFHTGDRVMVHLVGDTYDGKKAVDGWWEITVGQASSLEEAIIPIGTFYAYIAPSAVGNLDVKLFDKDWTAVGTSNAAAMSLDISDGTADWVAHPGTLKLILNEKYTAFGGQVAQPATSKGHQARTWTSVVTVEFNSTDVSFSSSGWSQVSGTSSSVKKYAYKVDRLSALDKIPQSIELPMLMRFTSAGGYKVTVTWYDFQIWEDAVANIYNTTAIAPEPAATYSKSVSFYFSVTA